MEVRVLYNCVFWNYPYLSLSSAKTSCNICNKTINNVGSYEKSSNIYTWQKGLEVQFRYYLMQHHKLLHDRNTCKWRSTSFSPPIFLSKPDSGRLLRQRVPASQWFVPFHHQVKFSIVSERTFWSFRIHLNIYIMKQILHFTKYKWPRDYKILGIYMYLMVWNSVMWISVKGGTPADLYVAPSPWMNAVALLMDPCDPALVIFPSSHHSLPYSNPKSQCLSVVVWRTSALPQG